MFKYQFSEYRLTERRHDIFLSIHSRATCHGLAPIQDFSTESFCETFNRHSASLLWPAMMPPPPLDSPLRTSDPVDSKNPESPQKHLSGRGGEIVPRRDKRRFFPQRTVAQTDYDSHL